jgi:uncharacterized membrane protein
VAADEKKKERAALPGPFAGPEPIRRNIRVIAELERRALHDRTRTDRIADFVTRVAGNGIFVCCHIVAFAGWVWFNSRPGATFDPYPFPGLSLVVSMEAIALASFVLMAQARITRQADRRAHLDLQIELLAEQELTAILQMLRRLCEHAGIELPVRDPAITELLKQTDIHQLAHELEKELSDESLL